MLPWVTPQHILDNLQVIASLRRGEKLSVLKDGEGLDHKGKADNLFGNLGRGHRGLREHFKVSTSSFARGKKGESITDRQVYHEPLKAFFSQACELYRKNRLLSAQLADVVRTAILNAVAGIRVLKDTYFQDYKQGEHRTAAEELVRVVEGVVQGITADWAEKPDGTNVVVPFADAWLEALPVQQRTDASLKHIVKLLARYHNRRTESGPDLFPEKTKKIFLRYDLYLATKGWLKRNEGLKTAPQGRVLGASRGAVNRQCYDHVKNLHETAKLLLCRSLRANPDTLKEKIVFFFGKSVDWLNVTDTEQLQAGSLLYMEENIRRQCRVIFRNGLVWCLPANAFSTNEDLELGEPILADTHNIREFLARGLADDGGDLFNEVSGFVVGHDRELYMTQHITSDFAQEMGRLGIKHSSYFAGRRVLFAGTIKIVQGRIRFIGCGSGHYKPTATQLLQCLEVLLGHGVSLRTLLVQDFQMEEVRGVSLAANAAKYLTKRGRIDVREAPLGDCQTFNITTL